MLTLRNCLYVWLQTASWPVKLGRERIAIWWQDCWSSSNAQWLKLTNFCTRTAPSQRPVDVDQLMMLRSLHVSSSCNNSAISWSFINTIAWDIHQCRPQFTMIASFSVPLYFLRPVCLYWIFIYVFRLQFVHYRYVFDKQHGIPVVASSLSDFSVAKYFSFSKLAWIWQLCHVF